jgi:hypothetical protein
VLFKDSTGVEKLNVSMIYMIMFSISRPFHRFHAWMCRVQCAAKSPGCCVFYSVLPKFSTEYLAETKFVQRYTRMALPIGTWNQGFQIQYSFRWLMMWIMAEIVAGSMITTYHLYRTLGI